MSFVSTPKDPARVARGKAGMRSRWGAPRVVRLDGLPPPVRDAVAALVAAAANAQEKTAPASDASEAVMPEVRDAAATSTD